MSKILRATLISMLLLFVMSIGVSFALATLRQRTQLIEIVTLIISFILFFGCGLVYGLINKKQGLSRALLLSLVYILIISMYYLFINNNPQPSITYLKVIGRVLLLITGSIIGVNIIDKKVRLK